MSPSRTPLETPSHNGAYRGTAPVRELPIGASGSSWTNPPRYALTIGATKRVMTLRCDHCSKTYTTTRKGRFCTKKCRTKHNDAKRYKTHPKTACASAEK